MQVGTGYFFDSRNRQMSALNGAAQRIQTQLATGKKLLAPSDDPVATGRLARMSIAQADQNQYAQNLKLAGSLLAQSDSTLESISNNLKRANELAIRAGNETLSAENRAAIAAELDAMLEDMLSLANTTDVRGNALFGGSADGPAYVRGTNGAIGFAGQGEAPPVPIGAGVTVAATDSGQRLFEGFTVGGAPSDLFKVVGDLAAALKPGGSADSTALRASLARANEGIAKAAEKIDTGRSSIGARAARLEIEGDRLAQAAIDNEIERGEIEGVNVEAAVVELQKTMLALEATQASFSKLSQLSLFDYIR
jgi:flagellar hook-associated protein 3 FlgL